MADRFFDRSEIERARGYHRPRYVLVLLNLGLGVSVLGIFAFSPVGNRLDAALGVVPWAARAALEAAIVLGVLEAVRLPGDFWIGHVRERRYGFSTQSGGAWLLDRLKAFAIGVVLSSAALAGFVATKHNAYVSGLGRTRRVVVFDTLLRRDRPRELRLIVAHELGHRRARHVLKGTLISMAGAAGAVTCFWGALRWDALPAPGNPRVVPFLLFGGALLELVIMPFGAALSRRWEREADRFSLELTQDPEAYAEAHRSLARANLSDLDPPRALYVLMFSHPTAPERLGTLTSWAESSPSSQSSSARGHSSMPS